MFLLTNAVRDYAWGSRTHIPRFLDVPPTDAPQAELWIGAHPGDPSRLPDGRSLDEAIRDDPERFIGPRVRTVFGDRLPFLLKALAAAEPLSLQVHPTSQRAELGYAAEEAAGVLLGAPERSYQDEFHKPEMVFALTRFEGMAGFRDVDRTIQILRLLNLPWADDIAWRLEDGPAFQTLRAVVTEMLAMGGPELQGMLADLRVAAARAEERGHREDVRVGRKPRERTSVSREGTRVFAQTTALVDRYPTDPGVLVTLLLNHVVLAPGEAMFLGAGVIHAYTSGFGIEIMASSDNVLRAGLTPKHVDVDELLQITNFTPMPPPQWAPTTKDGAEHFEPPVTEFALAVAEAPMSDVAQDGPRVVLVLDGSVTVTSASSMAAVSHGEALFVEHADGAITIDGTGRVAVASVPH